MFDLVNRKKRIVQIILGLAVLPFMFWGVESYRSMGSDGYVAIVDGEEISRREYEQALRDHHERLRAMLGANFNSAMLDSFEIKNSVLEQLIQQRLLQREASANGFAVLDSHLIKTLQEQQAFQKDGKFSKKQYDDLLKARGLTAALFESRVRQELLLQQLLDGYGEYAFVPKAVAEKVHHLSEVQREVNLAQITSDRFLSQVTPEETEIAAYYEEHKNDFDLPERARVEYLVLTIDAAAESEAVSEDAVKAYFDEHQQGFGQEEERKASHILISAMPDASDKEKQAAHEKAEEILQQVKQDPDRFAEIAKQHSDDPGSAMRGGDLGFFGRGVMVKSFEDKIFSMRRDEISDIVTTDFGFHIIKLTDIKEEKQASLEQVREQIEKILKREMVANVFGEIAEDFGNTVYEQNDSLKPAAEKFELIIETSDWITRNAAEPAILANETLLSAIFSDDTVSGKRNTEAVEVAPDTFVSARIIEHKPATSQSLNVVRDQIAEKLKQQMANTKAIEEGNALLARLQAGEDVDDIVWGETKQISYMKTQGLDHEILRTVFTTETDNLPAYAGAADRKGGFELVRINKIVEPESLDNTMFGNFAKQLQQMITQEEMSAYLTAIRHRYDVKVRQDSF